MQVNHEWNEFMLRSLNAKYVQNARLNMNWRHCIGNLYQSQSGELHACDNTCNRWVFRDDGLKICAITGICKNSSGFMESSSSSSQKKRKENFFPDHSIQQQNLSSKRRSFRLLESDEVKSDCSEEAGLCECAGYYGRCGMHC